MSGSGDGLGDFDDDCTFDDSCASGASNLFMILSNVSSESFPWLNENVFRE